MIKKLLIIVVLANCSLWLQAQTTKTMLQLTKGMVIESELVGYKTPMQVDALKWIKLKSSKKIDAVTAFNADVLAGKAERTITQILPTRINDVETSEIGTKYMGTVRIGNTDYNLTINQSNDTIYYKLNNGEFFPIVGKNNDTTGIWCYGVRKFPIAIPADSILPGYINEMNLFPYDLKTSRRTFFQSNDGVSGYYGFVNVRKTTKMSVSSIMMNTPFAIAGVEEFEISGKKYQAYKLINEFWTKSNVDKVVTEDPTVYFDNKQLSDNIKEGMKLNAREWERVAKREEKLQKMSGMTTNEHGYMVSLQENWYVPELGVFIKSRTYDATGAISMESKVVAIRQN